MMKLNKKVFFSGLILAILAPIAAQSAPKDEVAGIRVGFCSQIAGTTDKPLCNAQNIIDVERDADHATKIKPVLTSLQTLSPCSFNAIADFKGAFEGIKGNDDYKAAMAHFNASCVQKGKKTPTLPQPMITANIIQNALTKKISIQFYGKILGPDGKELTGLFGADSTSLVYHAEAAQKSSEDDDGLVKSACSKESDFIAGLAQSADDSDSSAILTVASKKISEQIEQLASDCKTPGVHKSKVDLMNDLSDLIAPPSLNKQIEGNVSAGSGA